MTNPWATVYFINFGFILAKKWCIEMLLDGFGVVTSFFDHRRVGSWWAPLPIARDWAVSSVAHSPTPQAASTPLIQTIARLLRLSFKFTSGSV
jgi:hypothetical protein